MLHFKNIINSKWLKEYSYLLFFTVGIYKDVISEQGTKEIEERCVWGRELGLCVAVYSPIQKKL
jgi:hypothetical protein